MDDASLWQFLRSVADRLHERLGRFDTGASWQRYLQLPDELLTDSSSGPRERRDAVTELLERFRYIATEPRYERIAGLSAFATTQAALAEVLSRLDAPAAAGAVPDEELPMPEPERSSRGGSFLNPASVPEYSDAKSRDRP
jgi:hypothetical protein